MNEENIRNALRAGICEVTFTKLNGESRTMKCTLSRKIVPSPEAMRLEPSNSENTGKPKTNISVYVPELSNWRSFRPESVISFVTSDGEKLI